MYSNTPVLRVFNVFSRDLTKAGQGVRKKAFFAGVFLVSFLSAAVSNAEPVSYLFTAQDSNGVSNIRGTIQFDSESMLTQRGDNRYAFSPTPSPQVEVFGDYEGSQVRYFFYAGDGNFDLFGGGVTEFALYGATGTVAFLTGAFDLSSFADNLDLTRWAEGIRV